MKLLDAATVIKTDSHFDSAGDSRDCDVSVILQDVCDETSPGAIVTSSAASDGVFRFQPFGIVARLDRSVTCERTDDVEFVREAIEEVTDRAIGRALVVEVVDSPWIGAAGVEEAAGVIAGRTSWFDSHVTAPLLHIAPEDLPAAVKDDLVRVTDDGPVTIWGDPVVVNSGYSGFPTFWTGPITVHLSTVDAEDVIRLARANSVEINVNRYAAIELSTCSIIRTAPMPV